MLLLLLLRGEHRHRHGGTVLDANELTGQSQMPDTRRSLYSVGAFLALPLAVLAGTAAGRLFTLVDRDGAPAVGLISGIVAWAALLGLLYRQLGPLRSARATAITMVAAAVLFLVEYYAGFVLILEEDAEGLAAYVALAVVLTAASIPTLRGLMDVGRGRRQS